MGVCVLKVVYRAEVLADGSWTIHTSTEAGNSNYGDAHVAYRLILKSVDDMIRDRKMCPLRRKLSFGRGRRTPPGTVQELTFTVTKTDIGGFHIQTRTRTFGEDWRAAYLATLRIRKEVAPMAGGANSRLSMALRRTLPR